MVYAPENHICTITIYLLRYIVSAMETQNERLSAMILRYFVDGAPPV